METSSRDNWQCSLRVGRTLLLTTFHWSILKIQIHWWSIEQNPFQRKKVEIKPTCTLVVNIWVTDKIIRSTKLVISWLSLRRNKYWSLSSVQCTWKIKLLFFIDMIVWPENFNFNCHWCNFILNILHLGLFLIKNLKVWIDKGELTDFEHFIRIR